MRVKEVADLVGISVRTLHHYDEIGLLIPEEVSPTGYRLYSQHNLETLQQILFFRELGFPLKRIKEIMYSSSFDKQEALWIQRNMLLEKRNRIDQMISTIDKTIKHSKGEIEMSSKERFEGFSFEHNPYEQEAKERWGEERVEQSKAKLGKMSQEQQEAMGREMNQIYQQLANIRYGSPSSEEAQAAIEEWYSFLNHNFSSYSLEAFKGLGEMYVADERFTKNIDQFGQGLASFMKEAMAIFADNNSK